MPAKTLTDEQCLEAIKAFQKHETKSEAARFLNLHEATFSHRLKEAMARGLDRDKGPILPDFGDEDLPVEELIQIASRRFEKRQAHTQQKEWFDIEMQSDNPCLIALVGDPHLDDDGCNWPLLTRDVGLMAKTPNVHAINLGDSTNNWTGRLMRLYAAQEASKGTGYKYVRWFMHDSNVKWLLWLLGNHDEWGDGALIIREMSADTVKIFDWQSKFNLVFPNKRRCPMWVAHSFKGNSMYNILHGPMRAIKFGTINVRVAAQGHHHEWGYFVTEDGDTHMTTHAIKARGYKHIDSFAERHMYSHQTQGSTMAVVINPSVDETDPGFITVFSDLEIGVDYLNSLQPSL